MRLIDNSSGGKAATKLQPIKRVSASGKQALLYTSHPSAVRLFSRQRRGGVHRTIATASAYRSMHRAVIDISNCVATWKPDLLFFFASGSFPYVVAALHRLSRSGDIRPMLQRQVHLMPGLSWNKESITLGDGETPMDYDTRIFARYVNGASRRIGRARPLKVLFVDTTSSGSSSIGAIFKMLDAAKARVQIGSRGAAFRLIAIFNGSRYLKYDKKRVSVRNGDRIVSQFNRSKVVRLPDVVDEGKWNSLTLDGANQLRLEIRPLVADSLITEDVAALIGFTESTYNCGGNPAHEKAAFLVKTDDRRYPLFGSSQSASSTFVNMMAASKSHPIWRAMRCYEKRDGDGH